MTPTARRLALLPILLLAAPLAAQGMVLGSFPGFAGRAGDVNGDGIGDVILHNGTNYWVIDGPTGAVIPYLTQPGGTTCRGVGDYDGDGKDDLACVAAGGSGAILSGNDGSTLLSFPAGNPSLVGILDGTDLDADGLCDPMLTRLDSATQTYSLEILSARTGGVLFQTSMANSPFVDPRITALGDVNGDGYEDAGVWNADVLVGIVPGPGSASVSVYLPSGKAVGDVDADGTMDIFSQQHVAVVAGASVLNGPTQVVWQFLLGTLACHGTGDLDGDGHADLAIQSIFTAGTFSGADHALFPGGALVGAAGVSLGDIDGDGRAEFGQGSTRVEWNDPALPIASRMLRRGTPGTTSSGRKPTIVTRGHCGLGHTMWFDIRGNEPDSLVVFAIGDAADVDLTFLGAPGNRAYTTMLGLSALLADGNGLAKLSAVMPTSPALLGATASVQAACFDAPANALGLVTSTAIDVETRN